VNPDNIDNNYNNIIKAWKSRAKNTKLDDRLGV